MMGDKEEGSKVGDVREQLIGNNTWAKMVGTAYVAGTWEVVKLNWTADLTFVLFICQTF